MNRNKRTVEVEHLPKPGKGVWVRIVAGDEPGLHGKYSLVAYSACVGETGEDLATLVVGVAKQERGWRSTLRAIYRAVRLLPARPTFRSRWTLMTVCQSIRGTGPASPTKAEAERAAAEEVLSSYTTLITANKLATGGQHDAV